MAGGVILDTTKLDRVLEITPGRAVVQAVVHHLC